MTTTVQLGYLAAAVLFILGLKGLSRPRTAVTGNQLGALGMLIAILVTVVAGDLVSYRWVLAGLVVGTTIGVVLATRVRMTAMPELVALFNGFGGAASVLVATALHLESLDLATTTDRATGAAAFAAGVGAITFTGSLIAFAKLQESLHWNGFGGIRLVNLALAAVALAAGVALVIDQGSRPPGCGWWSGWGPCSGCWPPCPSGAPTCRW